MGQDVANLFDSTLVVAGLAVPGSEEKKKDGKGNKDPARTQILPMRMEYFT